MVNVQKIWKWLTGLLCVIVISFHIITIIGNFINTPLNNPILLSVDISADDLSNDLDDYRDAAFKEVLFALVFYIQSNPTAGSISPVRTITLFFLKIKPRISRNIDSGLFDIPPPQFENSNS